MKACHICGKQLVLKPDPSCPIEWVAKLSSLPMTCNRCGDYGWAQSLAKENIMRECATVVRIQEAVKQRGSTTKQEEEAIEKCRKRLTYLTQGFVTRANKFHNAQVAWSGSLVDDLFAKPKQNELIMAMCERTVKDLTHTRPLATPAGPAGDEV